MKTLDLNAYGVMEMSHQDMVEADGGLVFLLLLVAKPLLDAAVEIKKEGGTLAADMPFK